jgi:hypothetical protein
MNALEMPRKKTGYSLDTRVIDAVQVLADRAGKSANQFLEKMLFDYAQLNGVIGEEEQPLGEGRGGKRPGAGKPKRSPTDGFADVDRSETTGKESDVDGAIDGGND